MKKGGKLVTCGATTGPLVKIDLRALFIKQQQLIGSTMGTLQDMREIMELVEQGKLKPVIDKVFPFEQISEAHARIENGEQFGKVVVSF
jgi:NADPH:quinone reductase-like Zn-dependent oxidoreductase